MNDVSFHEEEGAASKRVMIRESALERSLMKYSGGLIATKEQAAVAEIVLAALLVIVFILLLLNSRSATIEQPNEELINAEQPTRPITR